MRSRGRRTSSCAAAIRANAPPSLAGDDRASFGGSAEALRRPRRVLFVTGLLAEPALRNMLGEMAAPFACDVAALRITVAALMTTTWIARHLTVGEGIDLVLIPGLCEGDPAVIQEKVGVPVAKGPADLREIPRYFGRSAAAHDYGAWDIEILAEINNAPRMTREDIRSEAERYRASGADVIDIGCTPGLAFPELGRRRARTGRCRDAREHRHVRCR